MQKITADLSQLTPMFDGLPAQRVETGPLEINDDWPGVFVRGDNAMHYAMQLQHLINTVEQSDIAADLIFTLANVKSLANTLAASRI